MSLLKIDGSLLEGGGQVLRISLACASILKQPITVDRIRAGRSKPGLKAQHLKGVEILANMCSASVEGATMNSTEVSVFPSIIKPGQYLADTKTAGSVMLLFQAALPVALYAKGPVSLTLIGGTNADMAPPIDYTDHVFGPMAAKFGVRFNMTLLRRGFFPQGKGEVRIMVEPLSEPLIAVEMLNRGQITNIEGICYSNALPDRLVNRAVECAENKIKQISMLQGVPVHISRDIKSEYVNITKGFGMVLWAKTSTGLTIGASSIGQMHLRKAQCTTPEDIGTIAAEKLIVQIGEMVCVDKEMQDQIIILMGLANGRSKVLCGELSLHTKTAIDIMHQTTQAKFVVIPQENGHAIVECQGIGLNPDTMACNT